MHIPPNNHLRAMRNPWTRTRNAMRYQRMLASWRQDMTSEIDEIYGTGPEFEFVVDGKVYPLERSLRLPHPMPYDTATRYLHSIYPAAEGWSYR